MIKVRFSPLDAGIIWLFADSFAPQENKGIPKKKNIVSSMLQ